jgi:two-component system OmpR family sensor kinase
MSPPGRPKGEYRSAQHEGSPVSPPGRPKGEYRSAQHESGPVNSIRRRLLVWLLAGLSAATAAGAWAVYLRAREEARDLFDYQLRLLASTFPDAGGGTGIAPPPGVPGSEDIMIVQIWDRSGARLYLSRPGARPPQRAEIGFSTVRTPTGDWRVYTALVGENVIQISQSTAVREELAAGMALRTMLPLALLVPVLILLILVTVARGLEPLEAVAAAVRRRSADALEPLPESALPDEVRSLVVALNGLLARLGLSLNAQRALIADAAHELRTPLTALRLQIQLAERAPDDAERAAALARLKGGVERATRLVEQLLALARSEPDALATTMEPVALAALAREQVADLAPVAAAKGVDLGLAGADDVVATGDVGALEVLLVNLIDNAIRYTPAGGTVDVAVARVDGAPALIVEDNGPGIPPEARERVFDRFVRLESTEATGSGLGLAIVRQIADRHRASITLGEGRDGRGLRVIVRFPTEAGLSAP